MPTGPTVRADLLLHVGGHSHAAWSLGHRPVACSAKSQQQQPQHCRDAQESGRLVTMALAGTLETHCCRPEAAISAGTRREPPRPTSPYPKKKKQNTGHTGTLISQSHMLLQTTTKPGGCQGHLLPWSLSLTDLQCRSYQSAGQPAGRSRRSSAQPTAGNQRATSPSSSSQQGASLTERGWCGHRTAV